jgi:hypothetical protein
MPNLDGACDGKNPKQQTWNELDRNSGDEQLLAVEGVCYRTGK